MAGSLLRTCTACGKRNRVPTQHLLDQGHCGNCKALLPPLSEPVDVDSKTFDQLIAASQVPVLIDFCAEWCAPCRAAGPVVEAIAREMAGRAIELKVDTERNPTVAARYSVRGIPNFVVVHRGRMLSQHAGLTDPHVMKGWLEHAEACFVEERRV
jgi:thioredoxin 2